MQNISYNNINPHIFRLSIVFKMIYWKTGQTIQKGKYVIDKVLGAGGAGITYRATRKRTGQIIAVKTLNSSMQAQPDFNKHQERFVQEAFRLAKSSHPHVIRVDDVCKEDELWCMIMEYIDGGDLESLVKEKKGLSEDEALKYICQTGSALTYIHQQGILHRDVKPANIMRRAENNEAVLIDFGLARDFIEDKTQIQTNSRTEGFAPIEQYVRRARRGAYTDVYALAGTLYYLLTLQIPFPAQFRAQGIDLIPPKQHNPNISDELNSAILKGMELKPENRPQSIPELLSLLIGNTEISNPVEMESSTPPDFLGTSDESTVSNSNPSTPKIPTAPPIPPLPLSVNRRTQQVRKNTKQGRIRRSGKAKYDPLHPSRFNPPKTTSPQNSTETQNPLEKDIPSTVNSESPQKNEQNITREPAKKKNILPSAVGIDYTQLKDLLAAGKWQEADQETKELMLKAVEQEDSGWIDKKIMKNFPCEDLKTIDQLWVKYSKGRFGFSVQKRIYKSLGGKREYDKRMWEATSEKVGWRANKKWLLEENLNFSLTAPIGHLPSAALSGLLERGIYTLISRGIDCNI